MVSGSSLIQQVRTRILRQQQLNTIGFFFFLSISGWVLGYITSRVFSFPFILSVLPPLACSVLLGLALWKMRSTIDLQTSAILVDAKVEGKDRFLTLASVFPETEGKTLYSVVQQQATQIASSFQTKKEIPFSLERRTLQSACFALLSLLLFLFFSHFEIFPPPSPTLSQLETQMEVQVDTIEALENLARQLLYQPTSPQEQIVGAQLAALVQQLKDPSLSQKEKEQLIKETQKRLTLDLPFPQILPFDLKIFASKEKEGQGEGSDNNSSQEKRANTENSDPNKGEAQGSTAVAIKNESQQDSGQEKRAKPRQDGGGIAFNFPQTQTKNQELSSQESSEPGQKPAQEQSTDGLAPGSDPNQLGGGQDSKNERDLRRNSKNAGEGQNEQKTGGANVGQGKGQRFLNPGEQLGGGFLTEDANFVKVRVPVGQEEQGEDGIYKENKNRATPRTPYSNTPLKEAAPEQAQVKQPIPLEYRSILKD